MDLQPCETCGTQGFTWNDHYLADHDDRWLSGYTGTCPSCGANRVFEFVTSQDEPVPPAFGGAEPSQIIDPGQFFAMARELASAVPADPNECPPDAVADVRQALDMAIALLDEVTKFLPDGAAEVPYAAVTSAQGKAVIAELPGQLRRERLEAIGGAYRKARRAYGD